MSESKRAFYISFFAAVLCGSMLAGAARASATPPRKAKVLRCGVDVQCTYIGKEEANKKGWLK